MSHSLFFIFFTLQTSNVCGDKKNNLM